MTCASRSTRIHAPLLAGLLRSVGLIAAIGAVAVPISAEAATTGSISGTVLDDAGDGFPNVEVTLSADGGVLGGNKVVTTGADGSFSFGDLLPGVYTVTARKDGYKTSGASGIQVSVGQSATASVKMEAGSEGETITVVDKRETVDVDNVTRGEVLTKDFLQKIPTGRTYQSAVQQAAGVLSGNGGNPNMGGAAYNENTYMLDGVNITDPVTGTFSNNFNYDAIQQIEVLLGGYEPEYGISLGGIVNVVTASGDNNLKFNVATYYENGQWGPKLDARYSADGFQISPTDFDSSFRTYEGSALISGPIIRDKAWFLFSYSWQRSLISAAGIALPRDFDGHYMLGKLTVQPTSEHRFSVMTQLDPTTIDNVDQSTLTIRPEAQGRQAQGGVVGQLKWQWFLAKDANLETQFTYQKSYLEQGGVPCTHDRKSGYNPCNPDEQENDLDTETPGRFGIAGAFDSVNWPIYDFDDRGRYNASTKLSILSVEDPLGGQHDFKFGAETSQLTWHRITGYAGNAYYVDLNQVSYDPQTYQNYYWVETTGPWNFRATASNWDLFVQDAYKPISNLTIKYGVRYDNATQRNDLGEPVIAASLFGPRLYAAWDPFGDEKTKIGGGWGRFNDTGRLGVADFTSVSSIGLKLYLGEAFQGQDGQGFLNTAAAMADYVPRVNNNVANDKLLTPHSDEFLLMLQRQIIEDVSIGSTTTVKLTRYLYEPDEVNLIYDQDGSAVIGSRTGNPLNTFQRLRTPQLARRDYVQSDLFLDKVQARRWAARLTYTYVQSVGSSRSSLSGSFLNDPQTQYNYGNLYETDVRHQVKGWAFWDLPTEPWTQTIGAQLLYLSGTPFERLYWSEGATQTDSGYGLRIRNRGIYDRLPGWWSASVRFSQDFDVRKGKIQASIEASNVFSSRQPVDNDWFYVWRDNRNFVIDRQNRLQLMLGVRYLF